MLLHLNTQAAALGPPDQVQPGLASGFQGEGLSQGKTIGAQRQSGLLMRIKVGRMREWLTAIEPEAKIAAPAWRITVSSFEPLALSSLEVMEGLAVPSAYHASSTITLNRLS